MSNKMNTLVKLFLDRDIWREPFDILNCKRFSASDMDWLTTEIENFLDDILDLGVEDLPTVAEFIKEIEKEIKGWGYE